MHELIQLSYLSCAIWDHAKAHPLYTHPFPYFLLYEGLDNRIHRLEVKRLVEDMKALESNWEGLLQVRTRGCLDAGCVVEEKSVF